MKHLITIVSLLGLLACKQNKSYTEIETKNSSPVLHKIEIAELINGGDYLYLNVNEEGQSYWMAIPDREVTKGETYYYEGGMLMKDFESEYLSRTFDKIIFADGIRSTEKALPPRKLELPEQHPDISKKDKTTEINIDKPIGGVSLGELIENKEKFSGKTVKVSGKVTKINNSILDKNWIHISDGTAFEDKKSVTVTSQEFVKIGDTVTFEAKLTLKKDFGYGYVYDILLEDGQLID
jgi:hypothetical protein